MPNINVNWIPASGVLNQVVSARKKGDTTWITTGFNPANNQTGSATTTGYQNADINTVYEFKVNSLCTGGVMSPDSNITEGIHFSCSGWSTNTLTSTSVKTLIPASMLGVGISQVDVQLIDSAFNLISTQTTAYTGSGNVEYTFSGLSPNTTYHLRLILYATRNGNTEIMDSSTSTPCTIQITTSGSNNLTNVSLNQGIGQDQNTIEYYFSRVDTTASALAQKVCISYDITDSSTGTPVIVFSGTSEILPNSLDECDYVIGPYCNEFGNGGGVNGVNYTVTNIVAVFCI